MTSRHPNISILLNKLDESKTFKALNYINTQRLKNNQCMHIPQIQNTTLEIRDILSKDAQNYLLIPFLLVGTRDFKARIGTFNDPWGSQISPLYSAPPLKFINDSLADLADQRAIELIKNAKDTNRNIIVMWSGGIDSTFVLTAILKNISEADQELITVLLTTHSISDNPDFYFKFLSQNKKIRIISAANFTIDNDLLDKNIILHGDPGDGIFGPSSGMYKFFSQNQTHLEPWRKHLKTIAQQFEPTIEKDMFVQPGIGVWFTNIITQTLEESGYADRVSTVADWYWWSYFNFKWAGVCTYPLHNGIRGKMHKGITEDNHKFYADNIFFHTPEFQHWSYSNLKELIGVDVFKTHKLEAREYIYEFDKNFQYFSRKRKTSAPPPNNRQQKSSLTGHDHNWKPIYGDRPSEKYVMTTLLRKYDISKKNNINNI
jgi:hypothetical protein